MYRLCRDSSKKLLNPRHLYLLALLLFAGYSGALPALDFRDPEDGHLDLSAFLDRPYGFVPVISPITEPAVGYGAAAALVFVKKIESEEGRPPIRPNIGAVGGLATENGTRGGFGGFAGSFMDGRLRTVLGVARGDINLEFYGLGSGIGPGENGIEYRVEATGGMAGASYQLGNSGWWLGARYLYGVVETSLRNMQQPVPDGLPERDDELDLAALTPRLTLDTRNNFFTPTRGAYVDVSVPLFRDTWGSDRDFTKVSATGIWYRPMRKNLFFGVRGTVNASSGDTPFYLDPGINLRGVEAIKYQGDKTAEVEAELRWQFNSRYSLVGFAGTGTARKDNFGVKRQKTVISGGAGFRYLIARRYGMHMGLDVGFGPDNPILYVIFGSAWNRE